MQVVKGRLSLVEPSLSCGAFQYDEGEGLEEDEVRRALLYVGLPETGYVVYQLIRCAWTVLDGSEGCSLRSAGVHPSAH